MISINIHSKDYIWANSFMDYVKQADTGKYKVEIHDVNSECIKLKKLENAVHIIDDSVSISDDVNCIKLSENKVSNDDISTVCKYETADVLLNRIKKISDVKIASYHTKHYVFASTTNTFSTWIQCTNYAKELANKQKSVLLISFSHFDIEDCQKVNGDNFAKFVYYASVSDKRLRLYIDTLVQKNVFGYNVIPKPYIFDVAEWSENCTKNAMDSFDFSDDYDVVIWHMDGIYTSSFIPIYSKCDKLFWTTIYDDLRKDLSLKLLSDKCNRDFVSSSKCFYENNNMMWS